MEPEYPGTPEQQEALRVAGKLDELLTHMKVSNFTAVNALAELLRHANAQMYSQAFGRPEIHEEIAIAIAQDFDMLNECIMRKASQIALIIDPDGLLPN